MLGFPFPSYFLQEDAVLMLSWKELEIAGRRELKIDAYGETTFAGRREKQSQKQLKIKN